MLPCEQCIGGFGDAWSTAVGYEWMGYLGSIHNNICYPLPDLTFNLSIILYRAVGSWRATKNWRRMRCGVLKGPLYPSWRGKQTRTEQARLRRVRTPYISSVVMLGMCVIAYEALMGVRRILSLCL